MSGKNFVNQFKNTRRLAGLQNRRPLGGLAGLQNRRPAGAQPRPRFGKNANDPGRGAQVPFAGRRSPGKPRPEK